MKVNIINGMVDIDGHGISYSNIRDMYVTGNGCGLQVSEELEPEREKIAGICNTIADQFYKLNDIEQKGIK